MNGLSAPRGNSIEKFQFIYHFIPHKQTKVRARLLTNQALITYALVQIVFIAVVRILPLFAPGVLGYASNINTNDLLRYTNETRTKVGLKPLNMNQELAVAAQKKANDMFKVGYWSHISPLGAKPWDFILDADYDYVYAGENLAKNFSSSKDVVEAWYASPTHRDNLLSTNYDDIGFAVMNGVIDGYETTIVVQMFGRERVPVKVAAAEPVVKAEEPVKEIAEVESPAPVEETAEIPAEQPEQQLAVNVETQPQTQEFIVNETPERTVEGEVTPILQQLTGSESLIQETQKENNVLIDVKLATKAITYAFGGFLILLLSIDIWYSRRHGILKVTGHTLAHLVFLAVILLSVMLSIVPGAIL